MISLALALLLQAAPAPKAPAPAPRAAKVAPAIATPLSEEKLEAYRAAIRPDDEERAYLEIDWKPTLLAGLAEAQKADKPLLFWAVHGQPFGCV